MIFHESHSTLVSHAGAVSFLQPFCCDQESHAISMLPLVRCAESNAGAGMYPSVHHICMSMGSHHVVLSTLHSGPLFTGLAASLLQAATLRSQRQRTRLSSQRWWAGVMRPALLQAVRRLRGQASRGWEGAAEHGRRRSACCCSTLGYELFYFVALLKISFILPKVASQRG